MDHTYMKKKSDEIIVDLKEFFWQLLLQWKAIIALALIFMIVFSGLMYFKDSAANNAKAESETTVETPEEILASLAVTDREPVQAALSTRKTLDNLREYIRVSPYMNLDPNRVNTLKISFALGCDSGISKQLSLAYMNELTSFEVASAISDVWGKAYDADQVKELISVVSGVPAEAEAEPDGNVMNVLVYIPEGMDAAKASDTMLKSIDEASGKLNSAIGSHSINVIGNDVQVVSDLTFSKNQTDVYNKLYSLTQQHTYYMNAMNIEQKDAYNKLLLIDAEGDTEGESEPAEPEKVSMFSVKNLLVGFILGCILYCGIYLLYFVFSGRMFSSYTVDKTFGLRKLGEYYANNKEGIAGLLTSGIVFKRRYRGHLNLDKESDNVCDTIVNAFDNIEDKRLLLVSSKKAGKACEAFTEVLAEKVKDAGIEIARESIDLSEGITLNETAIKNSKKAVALIDIGKTTKNDVKEVCEKSYYCEVPIVGVVYTGL